jgi:hypothetical protein
MKTKGSAAEVVFRETIARLRKCDGDTAFKLVKADNQAALAVLRTKDLWMIRPTPMPNKRAGTLVLVTTAIRWHEDVALAALDDKEIREGRVSASSGTIIAAIAVKYHVEAGIKALDDREIYSLRVHGNNYTDSWTVAHFAVNSFKAVARYALEHRDSKEICALTTSLERTNPQTVGELAINKLGLDWKPTSRVIDEIAKKYNMAEEDKAQLFALRRKSD